MSMSVTKAEYLEGVLVAVISGGRNALKSRPTAGMLRQAENAGAQVAWIVSERDAPGYERDRYPVETYTSEWAFDYASKHWTDTLKSPDPHGFLGAFVGREAACVEAERRGCWAVMQLDDNIIRLGVIQAGHPFGHEVATRNGGLALHLDMLAGIARATNMSMVGAQLCSIGLGDRTQIPKIARTGYPYSCFIEKVGAGREHWFGPFEDDIMHSMQYGLSPLDVTAGVFPNLRYLKAHGNDKTGMRKHYNHTRAVALQRMFPQIADIAVRATHSNGRGSPRVFHRMTNRFHSPIRVVDADLLGQVKDEMTRLVHEVSQLRDERIKHKVMSRLD